MKNTTYSGSGPSTLVSRLALPNGAFITNQYDSVARLLSTKLLNSSSSVLDSESYGYNQAGQRIVETNSAGDFRNYTYDNAGELTTAIGKEAGGTTNRLQEQLGYSYDGAANLNYRTNNGLLSAFSVNNLNELTTVTNGGRLTVAGTTTTPATSVSVNTSNAVLYADATFASTNQPWLNGANTYTAIGTDSYGRTSSNSVTVNLQATNGFAYDLNGNLLNDTNRNFAYDDENQLTSVWGTNAWRCDFVYDGKFRRRIEKDFAWQGGAWVQTNEAHFIYDGNLVIQERNAGNAPQVTYTSDGGTLLARSDYGQEIPGAPTTAYYHVDGNANVMMLIFSNQIVAAKYLYGPFGDPLSMSGPLAPYNTPRYSSKEWNNSAQIYYFGRRYYDPILQRFLNHDPIAEHGGMNLYAYVANNPINAIDMLGLLVASNPTTSRGAEEHNSFVIFVVTCPKDKKFQFDHFDYSKVVPALIAAGYSAGGAVPFVGGGVHDLAGKTPTAADLGGSPPDHPPKDVNCDGRPTTVYGWMRSRFASTSADLGHYYDPRLGKIPSQAGADAYQNTTLVYECVCCPKSK